MLRRSRSGFRAARLSSYDLDDPAAFAFPIELEEEDALPRSERELALADGDGLARGAEQHRHAVGMPVSELHVLRADVLGAAVPVVVGVVAVARNERLEQACEVLEEPILELVHAHAAGRVRRVHAGNPVPDAALADGFLDLFGDVPDGQAAARAERPLELE